jgi:hypothetical protein
MLYVHAGSVLQATKFSNDTTFAAGGTNPLITVGVTGVVGNFHWLRVTDDGTNLRFALSLDGVNFLEYGTEGRTVFMAGGPNQVGSAGRQGTSAIRSTDGTAIDGNCSASDPSKNDACVVFAAVLDDALRVNEAS